MAKNNQHYFCLLYTKGDVSLLLEGLERSFWGQIGVYFTFQSTGAHVWWPHQGKCSDRGPIRNTSQFLGFTQGRGTLRTSPRTIRTSASTVGGGEYNSEHLPVFRAYARARHAPHQSMDEGRSTPDHPCKKKMHGKGPHKHTHTDRQADFATTRRNQPSGPIL